MKLFDSKTYNYCQVKRGMNSVVENTFKLDSKVRPTCKFIKLILGGDSISNFSVQNILTI